MCQIKKKKKKKTKLNKQQQQQQQENTKTRRVCNITKDTSRGRQMGLRKRQEKVFSQITAKCDGQQFVCKQLRDWNDGRLRIKATEILA